MAARPHKAQSSSAIAGDEAHSRTKDTGDKFGQGLQKVPSRSKLRQPKHRRTFFGKPAPQLDLGELDSFEPVRPLLDWDVPEGDLSDLFHEHHFGTLVVNVYDVLKTYLVDGPLNRGGDSWFSPWIEPVNPHISPELQKYVETVARPDPSSLTAWDDLLAHTPKRLLLLQAVLLRIFDDHIFSKLLFGAKHTDTRYLQDQDESFLEDDGYQRTRLRSVTVNMFLEHHHGIPLHFWKRVDDLTMRITVLLLPILNWVRVTKTPDLTSSLKDFHQDIHNLVSYAAWFSICIRRSPSIIRLDWLQPGDRYQPNQTQVEESIFESSQKAAQRHDEKMRSSLVGAAGAGITKPNRMARIMISITPEIKRYTVEFDKNRDPPGVKVYSIMKSHLAYYHGLLDDNADRGQYVSLTEYIEAKKQTIRTRTGRHEALRFVVSVFCVIVLFTMVAHIYKEESSRYIEEIVKSLGAIRLHNAQSGDSR